MYNLSVGDEGMLDPFSGRTGGLIRFELFVGSGIFVLFTGKGGGLGMMVPSQVVVV